MGVDRRQFLTAAGTALPLITGTSTWFTPGCSNYDSATAQPQENRKSDGVAAPQPNGPSAPGKLAPPGPTSWVSFRNGLLQQGIAGSKLPEKLELLWKKKTEHGTIATAAIVGNHVYVPTLEGLLFCFDRQTGKEIWKYRSVADPKEFAPGIASAPTISATTVYVGDEDGLLHALDRATGKKRWVYETGAKIPGGAQIVGNNVIFGSHDSYLYSVDAKKGTLVWKFMTLDRINCAPAIVKDFTFVAGCDKYLRRINIKTRKQVADFDLNSEMIASPAIRGDFLYVGGYRGEFFAYNWKTDKLAWRYGDPITGPEFRASAAVTEKYVLVGARDKKLHCLHRKTGIEKWSFPTRAQIDSAAVVVGDRVFFGSDDKNVYSVRLSDGKLLWKFHAGHSVVAGPAVGEGVLVIGGADAGGFIYCFGKKT